MNSRIGFPGSSKTVRAVFEEPGNPIREFMGGGALIVEGGATVSSADLRDRQGFERGADAPQFERVARHIMIAVHADGAPYLVIDMSPKRLAAMQTDLIAAGFRDVVMFDGGHAFGYEDGQRALFGRVLGWQPAGLSDAAVAALRGGHAVALTGFAIKTR